LRDMLADLRSLEDKSSPGMSPLSFQRNHYLRLQNSTKFYRALNMNLLDNTTKVVFPQPNLSIKILTNSNSYTLVAENKHMLWAWLKVFRRSLVTYHLRLESQGVTSRGPGRVPISKLYKNYHLPELEYDRAESYTGPLSVRIDSFTTIKCECTLRSRDMILRCCEVGRMTAPVELDLSEMVSITCSREFPLFESNDLRVHLLGGRLPGTALKDALKRGKVGVGGFEVAESLGPSQTGPSWYPGKVVYKGTLLTAHLAKSVVVGTVEGTSTLVKGTAGLATSAAEGLVSASATAVGIKIEQEEISTMVYVNPPNAMAVLTKSVSGLAPYWDTPLLLKLGSEILNDVFNSTTGPYGVILHLMSEYEEKECHLGSKFIPYSEILPPQASITVDDSSRTGRGGLPSTILDKSFSMDTEIAFTVEVVRAVGLLPAPDSDSINTIISHPLDSFVNLSSLAATAVGSSVGKVSTSKTSESRNPRVDCSFAKWNGSEPKKYDRSKFVVFSLIRTAALTLDLYFIGRVLHTEPLTQIGGILSY
jgi:hypothetical protein